MWDPSTTDEQTPWSATSPPADAAPPVDPSLTTTNELPVTEVAAEPAPAAPLPAAPAAAAPPAPPSAPLPSPNSAAPLSRPTTAFGAIGAPAPERSGQSATVLGSALPASVGAAPPPPPRPNVGGGSVVLTNPVPTVTEPPRKRRWPLLALALATVAASGLIAWLVATSVSSNTTDVAAAPAPIPVQSEGTGTTAPAATTPQIQSTLDGASGEVLEDEPFAQAAEIIRPSVVQLNLAGGVGTGIIIDSNGTILTAAHVVGDSSDVRVTFFDGSSIDGEVVGTHEATDVAVVRVDATGRSLVAAQLADGDDVRVGQLAVAVGSPFGFDQTVTAGIISAVDRIVNGVSMVQTDAPINPGNSGGPLINLDGEVVGINDLIFTESGTSAGVGFAISIDLAVIIADQLIAGVEPQLALLGVSTGAPPNGEAGAQVGDVVGGSAAEAAGLEVGDIVVGINGVATRGSADLRAQIIDNAPGTTVTISIIRDGEPLELTATLGETGN